MNLPCWMRGVFWTDRGSSVGPSDILDCRDDRGIWCKIQMYPKDSSYGRPIGELWGEIATEYPRSVNGLLGAWTADRTSMTLEDIKTRVVVGEFVTFYCADEDYPVMYVYLPDEQKKEKK